MSNTSNCISVDKEALEDGEEGELPDSVDKTSNKGGNAPEDDRD